MRCIYCRERAGLLKKICGSCGEVVAIVGASAGHVGWTELIDRFASRGLNREQVDRVLDTELDGEPSMRDRLTAEMANVLMRGLGMPGRQSPEDVQRVRHAAAAEPEPGKISRVS